ncbi:hypothetical protein scyTo_0009131 [Scyliorhinus torazame]|uniref:Uncharacterized protein n=1 Tax=Scyliorhinus torazame TaxID=75743 RepID=A0A401NH63_SCYTO|nr:hypothetical protein [Scyliorhinus torazame]
MVIPGPPFRMGAMASSTSSEKQTLSHSHLAYAQEAKTSTISLPHRPFANWVDQEDTTEKDEEQPAETGLAVIETGLSVIHIAQSVIEIEHFDVEIVELESDLDEDDQEPTIIDDDLPRETLLTCPAKDAASFKTKVKEEIPKLVSEVISLGEHKNTSATNETVNLTEKVVHKDQPAEGPIQQFPQGHLEHDVIILLAVHLTLVIFVLLMGCRCLCAHKYDVHSTVNVEELLVTASQYVDIVPLAEVSYLVEFLP